MVPSGCEVCEPCHTNPFPERDVELSRLVSFSDPLSMSVEDAFALRRDSVHIQGIV